MKLVKTLALITPIFFTVMAKRRKALAVEKGTSFTTGINVRP